MILANGPISNCHSTTSARALLTLTTSLALHLSGCGDARSDSDGRQLPSDEQVIVDVTPADTENVVDVDVTVGSDGELYLHDRDLVWTFDRGVVIKRKAGLDEAPDATVVVGGLARYQLVGDQYEYRRFLTTYNEYEGIPEPSATELTAYVENNLDQAFVSRDHKVVAIEGVEIEKEAPWTWHSTVSFTAPFRIQYTHRTSNTTLEERDDLFDVRFYKKAIDAPLHALMATEKSRTVLRVETLAVSEIDQMKTLRTDFK